MKEINLEYICSLIDFTRLKRNYLENPLKKRNKPLDIPYKEDLEYLYLELNLDQDEIGIFINTCKIGNYIKSYNIIKSRDQIHECRARKNLWKYGVRNPSQLKEIQDKIKKNNLEKYGVESANSLSWKKENCKKTCLEKYGTDNIFHNVEYLKKCRKEKYGYEYCSQAPEIKEKVKQTNKKKYGVEYPSQLSKFKNKYKNLEFKNAIIKKQRETKHKNQSFRGSKMENSLYNKLLEKFSDVIHHYSIDSRYPFECDFYIPSKDLFIEYQGFWTHGFHPFDKNNPEDLRKIKELKEKSKEVNYKQVYKNFYLNAIFIWTDLDVRKRETAKKNNLNYLEFFNMEEFMDWYNKQ